MAEPTEICGGNVPENFTNGKNSLGEFILDRLTIGGDRVLLVSCGIFEDSWMKPHNIHQINRLTHFHLKLCQIHATIPQNHPIKIATF